MKAQGNVTVTFSKEEVKSLRAALEYTLQAATKQAKEPEHHEEVARLRAMRDKVRLEFITQVAH